MRMVIFGLGYSAKRVADRLMRSGWHVDATGSDGTLDFADCDAVASALADADALLSSVPPAREGGDPVLDAHGSAIARFSGWLGYLSSTGVYGDAGGAWVDESAPVGTGRRTSRCEADSRWLSMGARVLRLPGIYGPGRSALDRVREGRAHRIDMPGQVFSRIHVEDIAAAVAGALVGPPGAYNIGDDLPAPHNAVIAEACRLLGLAVPPLESLQEAGLAPAARAFYAENRRVANGRAKRVLGWSPRHPTFREGLAACLAAARD